MSIGFVGYVGMASDEDELRAAIASCLGSADADAVVLADPLADHATYDALSLRLGQMTVYRVRLRCRCRRELLRGRQHCGHFLPYERQGWPAYMGSEGRAVFVEPDSR